MREGAAGVEEGLKCRPASGGVIIRNEDRTEALITSTWRPMHLHYGDTTHCLGGWLGRVCRKSWQRKKPERECDQIV